MASSAVREALEKRRERNTERERGTIAGIGSRFAPARQAESLILSVARLPVVKDSVVLQNPTTGAFLPLAGYDDGV